MATQSVFDRPMSVEAYLTTSFEHDCDYVDGVIEERALGEFEHSFLQIALGSIFFNHRQEWGITSLTEQRIRLSATRFRVPDLAVLRAGTPRERVLTKPPMLVIEIQSPEDTLRRTTAKVLEYLEFGVENVWVVDPASRIAYRGTTSGLEPVEDGQLSVDGTPIRILVGELFAELDKA